MHLTSRDVHFSELIKALDPDENLWLRERIRKLEEEHGEDLGFEARFDTEELEDGTDSSLLWLYADHGGSVAHVIELVQSFLQRWRPHNTITLQWIIHDHNLIVGGITGGAVFVTVDEVQTINLESWLVTQQMHHQQVKLTPTHQPKESS